MDKRIILKNTILFIVMISFIVIFKSIFGEENVLIGVTSLTAMLMFLGRDLSLSPLKYTLRFVGINVTMGIGAFLANQNMWLAIPINFTIMFFLSYSFVYNLQKPIYLPFSLQYLFIVSTPISIEQLPMRLLALVTGGVLIMVLQVLLNKRKMTKAGGKLLENLCEMLIQQIDCLLEDKKAELLKQQIAADLSTIRRMIYEKREEDFYLTEQGSVQLNLSSALEQLYLLLGKEESKALPQDFLNEVKHCLEVAKRVIKKEIEVGEYKKCLEYMLEVYQHLGAEAGMPLYMIKTLGFLEESLLELVNLKKERYNLVGKIAHVSEYYQGVRTRHKGLKEHSLKFSYAMRMGVAISIGAFIMDGLQLSEGRWILFTILSVMVPIYDMMGPKIKDRLFATLVGAISVVLLFSVFTQPIIRTVILLLSGYINSYIKKYRYSTILVTLSAVGSAALSSRGAEVLSITRIFMVGVGVIIAWVISRFLFTYKLEDESRDLDCFYQLTLKEMLIEIEKVIEKKGDGQHFKNLFIRTTLIEESLKQNKQLLNQGQQTIKPKRMLVNSLYELYRWLEHHEMTVQDKKILHKDLQMLLEGDKSKKYNILEQVKKQIPLMENMKDKLVLSSVLQIAYDIEL
ncbi:hypothetical protein CS063_12290 [Sporanaerobium hydrogeniformans]|uniref:Uncharacterized protein n=1 Tax=Sporanaerobium hydrogeniformans TaxID=3072179 RepID=A0AC61DBC2_9FIRM|nr:FUSC family protein [Sporanaerobium hydrogeniformans]PHV70078.1 hypothetical protein CS063_12290 [Sporanaerobium hydrogeniformans]